MDKRRARAISGAMDADVIIVGGGLGGGALALALAQGGLSSVIVDPLPAPDPEVLASFDGRAYAIAQGSMRMLRALGLGEALAPDAEPILDIKVADGRPGRGATSPTLHFDHAEIEEGPMGFMIEERHLARALARALAAEPRARRVTGRVAAQEADEARARVRLEDGRAVEGRLVAGADGRGGGTARRAGIDRSSGGYGRSSLTCAVTHARAHRGTAYQLFLPAGPLAILPLRGDRSAVVWTERRREAERLQSLPDEAYLDALRPRFGGFLGEIALVGRRGIAPLSLVIAQRLVAPRVVLVGDAAHGVHPVAGQGLNAGLRDVAALAEVLSQARGRGQDLGEAGILLAYERWRRFDVALLAVATDGLSRLFSNDLPGLRALRGAGLGAVARLPLLKRAFIREAAGLTGEVPRLMRGQPL